VSDVGIRIGKFVEGFQTLVNWQPRLTPIVGAEGARGRDGDHDPIRVVRIEDDGVQAHPASARLPEI
jgi:hypothetical protein